MISKYSVKRPYTVLVAVVLVIVLGVVSLSKMTTDLLPDMSFQYALVITTDMGASPEQVESDVTAPIESAMATTSNIKNISSISYNSYSVVTLEYEQNANMDSVVIEIQQSLDQISGQWDDSIGTPMIMKVNPDMLPVLAAAVDMDGMDAAKLSEYVEKLNALFADDLNDEPEEVEKTYPPYGEDDFLQDVFMQQEDYEKLVDILKIKKNIILQGAPGVGKTYAAKRLAYSIMGEKDVERVMMVQFHQSYSYEDFIMGYRPTATGFELKKGAFYNFCKKAEIDTDRDYFFIIDEINRGNLSKIFGELFMLIENDKRGIPLQLLYADEKFSVPRNVYLIGMMNTADRSLAMLDYALRRRFAFVDLKPGFETEGFRAYQEELQSDAFDRLIACVLRLNAAIAADESLGEGFCIGHSYFCNRTKETTDAEHLNAIVEYELIPLLREYWFDEPEKVRDWAGKLRSAIR